MIIAMMMMMMMVIMIMMIMNGFYEMIERTELNFIFSQNRGQRFQESQNYDTPRARFKLLQNLS